MRGGGPPQNPCFAKLENLVLEADMAMSFFFVAVNCLKTLFLSVAVSRLLVTTNHACQAAGPRCFLVLLFDLLYWLRLCNVSMWFEKTLLYSTGRRVSGSDLEKKRTRHMNTYGFAGRTRL